jgi:hypothetical protein
MILMTSSWDNGYNCTCCRQETEDIEWIQEKDAVSPEDLYDNRNAHLSSNEYFRNLGLKYERDGELLYGIERTIIKKRIYFLIGEKRYLIEKKEDDSSEEKVFTKSEICDILNSKTIRKVLIVKKLKELIGLLEDYGV